MRSTNALALALSAGLSFGAAAQMVTPPPPPTPEEEYTPPAERERPAPPPVTRAAEPAEPAFDPSTVEFEPIFGRDENGKIIHPTDAIEVVAIRNNPLIGDDIRFVIDELLIERGKRAETVVIGAPREAIEVALGIIDTMDFGDRSTVENVARVATELQLDGGVIADLAKQGVLTEQARLMSVHMWQDYNRAVNIELAETFADSEEPNALLNAQSRYLMGASMQEIQLAFGRVARRALMQLETAEAKEALNLEGQAFREAAGEILSQLDDERLAEVFR